MKLGGVNPSAQKNAGGPVTGRNAVGVTAVGASILTNETVFLTYQRDADHCR